MLDNLSNTRTFCWSKLNIFKKLLTKLKGWKLSSAILRVFKMDISCPIFKFVTHLGAFCVHKISPKNLLYTYGHESLIFLKLNKSVGYIKQSLFLAELMVYKHLTILVISVKSPGTPPLRETYPRKLCSYTKSCTRLAGARIVRCIKKEAHQIWEDIWVEIIGMGNMHFLCHFLSVFIVTWSQNEPLKSREKSTQLTSTLRRVIALPCFYFKFAQFKTIYNFWFVESGETL